MCGLAGFIGEQNENLSKVLSIMSHRGPDSSGIKRGSGFGLGFRRLSIRDLSNNGSQPISDQFDRYHLVFNGEIYNADELKKKWLSKFDINFEGTSDSEILFHLLIRYGLEILNELNGMFAFCFINEAEKNFVLVRDRFGVKPLFYSLQPHGLYFASELEPLLEFGIEKEIDAFSLNYYLRFGNIKPPGTIYKGVNKLEPGSLIQGSLENCKSLKKERWYDLPSTYREEKKTYSEVVEKIDSLILDATKIRMISDLPVGMFLSGGIDSAIVLHYLSKTNAQNVGKCVNIGFDVGSHDESEIARLSATEKGTDFVTEMVELDNLSELTSLIRNVGEPLSDSSLVNTNKLALTAKKFGTVYLSGDGGDEAFAGYNEYISLNNNYGLYRFLASVVDFTSGIGLESQLSKIFGHRYSKFLPGSQFLGLGLRLNFSDFLFDKIINDKYKVPKIDIVESNLVDWEKSKGMHSVKRMQLYDYNNYLEPEVLVKMDRMSMRHSLEVRSPFLDYRVVESAIRIPVGFNIDKNFGKVVLRDLARRNYSSTVTEAKKRGFGAPLSSWLTTEVRKSIIETNKRNQHDFWDQAMFQSTVLNNAEETDAIVYRLLVFEEWYSKQFSK